MSIQPPIRKPPPFERMTPAGNYAARAEEIRAKLRRLAGALEIERPQWRDVADLGRVGDLLTQALDFLSAGRPR